MNADIMYCKGPAVHYNTCMALIHFRSDAMETQIWAFKSKLSE